jgi:hypothetical protein
MPPSNMSAAEAQSSQVAYCGKEDVKSHRVVGRSANEHRDIPAVLRKLATMDDRFLKPFSELTNRRSYKVSVAS